MLSIEEYEAGVREDRGVRYYQTMPPLKADEYDELRADIRANGITVPVIVDEHGNVIDGHHRTMIARELGIDFPKHEIAGLSEPEKLAMSVSLNIKRRQLSREEKRQVIAAQLKAAPEKSNREHAKALGVDHKTVQSVRQDEVSRGEIPHVDVRQDSMGRMQPASRPAVESEIAADPDTGEVIDGRSTYADEEHGIYIVGDSDFDDFVDAVEDAQSEAERAHPAPPVRDDDYWNQQNAEQGAQSLGRALQTLKQFRHDQKRALFLTEWLPRGLDAVPPGAKELINPADMQLIAGYLTQLAKDMEKNS